MTNYERLRELEKLAARLDIERARLEREAFALRAKVRWLETTR